jgi:hypothetical protein
MRKALLFAWMLLPVAAGAYHFGPGQDRVRVDQAAEAALRAEEAANAAREIAAQEGDLAAHERWAEAEAAYSEAIELLPAGMVAQSRALRLERAKAQMFVSQLPEARRELEGLVREVSEDPAADRAIADGAREALANAQYYTTWLMRLEGASREEWEPEIEASRQHYKWLAEESARSGDMKLAAASRENLESAVRLARMDLTELQGLPLPSQ